MTLFIINGQQKCKIRNKGCYYCISIVSLNAMSGVTYRSGNLLIKIYSILYLDCSMMSNNLLHRLKDRDVHYYN